jgi:hypothetical protein
MDSSPQSETNFVQGAQLGGGMIAVPLTRAFGTPDTLTGTLPALSDTADDPNTCRVFHVVASVDIASSSTTTVKIGGTSTAQFLTTVQPYNYIIDLYIMWDPNDSTARMMGSCVGTAASSSGYTMSFCEDLTSYSGVVDALRAGTTIVIEFTGDNSTNNGGFIIGG